MNAFFGITEFVFFTEGPSTGGPTLVTSPPRGHVKATVRVPNRESDLFWRRGHETIFEKEIDSLQY